MPTSIVTGRYGADDAALRDLGLSRVHIRGKPLNNRGGYPARPDPMTGVPTHVAGYRHVKNLGIMQGEDTALQVGPKVVTAFNLWFPKNDAQRVLWPSVLRLSLDYYESLTRFAVPMQGFRSAGSA